MDELTTVITPTIAADDLYKGTNKEFNATPPGTYRMALTGELRVKKSKAGNAQLEAFFKHVDKSARSQYKGVNLRVNLEGTDKNGRSNARQFGDMLQALGVSSEDIINGNPSVSLTANLASIPAEDQWKGIPAVITINGDVIDLSGREASVVVEASSYQGKVSYRATGIYKAD